MLNFVWKHEEKMRYCPFVRMPLAPNGVHKARKVDAFVSGKMRKSFFYLIKEMARMVEELDKLKVLAN